jgi:hypothetical protein
MSTCQTRGKSVRIAIIQSCYVPWKGFFDLIGRCDEYVIFDSAQYAKRHWHNRNRIKTARGLEWLTIPVISKGRYRAVAVVLAAPEGGVLNVLLSERVFIGDNNHGFLHLHVPIMQQPNKRGKPIVIGKGTWVGVGAAILAGTRVGRNCVIGANSVCRGGDYPSHSVIGPDEAKVFYRRFEHDE